MTAGLAADPAAGARPAGPREAFANPNFRRLWFAELISRLGDGLTSLAVLVVIHRITGSVTALAGMAIVTSLPQLVFGLHAGVLADRLDRRRILIVSDVLRGLVVLSLVTIRRADQVPLFYALGLLQATVGVFFEPARAAFLPAIVEPGTLLAANALSQTARVGATMAGAALAGLLLTLPHGAAIAFGLDAASFWLSAVLVAAIPVVARALPAADAPRTRHLDALLEGIRHLFGSRVLVGLFLTFAIAMLGLGAVNVLFLPFLTDELHGSTAVVGIARGAQMLGLLAGGAVVSVFARRVGPTTLVVAGICALGLAFAGLGLLHSPWLVVLVLAAIGACSSALTAGTGTLLQQRVPDALRGRLESSLDTLLVLVLMLAMAGAGVLGDRWGTRRVLFLAGAAVVFGGIVGAWTMGGARPATIAVDSDPTGSDPSAVAQPATRSRREVVLDETGE